MGKERPGVLEVYNDANQDLYQLFLCMKERVVELMEALGCFPINSRDGFKQLKHYLAHGTLPTEHLQAQCDVLRRNFAEPEAEELCQALCARTADPIIQRAAMFLQKCNCSFNSTGTSFGRKPLRLNKLLPLLVEVSKRLENVLLENLDFEPFIMTYDSSQTVYFCDPPYVDTEKYYSSGFTWEDHLRLFYVLNHCLAKWQLCYNDCPEVRRLYHGFPMYAYTRPHSMAREKGREFKELLITNYDMNACINQYPKQLNLFEMNGELTS